jgi:hypothetical protein
MQDIEPFYNWESHYVASNDPRSPFHERLYNTSYYENDIYGYYIHPFWDHFESETLYCKLLFVDYQQQYAIIEMFGEWNDTLHNDIMLFKRKVIDHLLNEGVTKFILIGENVLNFHGTQEDDYYAEWFEEIEDGWIAACNFREFIQQEWTKYRLDYYLNFGGTLDVVNWRVLAPNQFYEVINALIIRRLN